MWSTGELCCFVHKLARSTGGPECHLQIAAPVRECGLVRDYGSFGAGVGLHTVLHTGSKGLR